VSTETAEGSDDSSDETGDWTGKDRASGLLLLAAVFVLAVCGLVYELIAGTLSSYLLGDSVTQFSLAIGLFLFGMGLGSYISRFVTKHLLAIFIAVELLIGLVGGAMALVGFALFAFTEFYVPGLIGMVIAVGLLVGLEIPLVIRILRESGELRVTVANVLSVDYVGALIAAVIFPFLLLPQLGLARAGLVMGLSNVLVGALLLGVLGDRIGRARRPLGIAATLSALLLVAGLIGAGQLVDFLENKLYQHDIILSRTTAHQRLVVTRNKQDIRLFLNGQLQFSSIDEYRYHEALVHPAMSLAEKHAEVLILGGGDGMAVREVLKFSGVTRIDLVDLDPIVTGLFTRNPLLSSLNGGSLKDPRVHIHNQDAMRYLETTKRIYDVILLDLPDPSEAVLGKLYSRPFYRLASQRLAPGGMLTTQATSPFRSREAFWCIVHTMRAAGFQVRPYHTIVPTFGTWGFALAGRGKVDPARIKLEVPTRYLTAALLPGLFAFPKDMAEVSTPISGLNDPVVTRLYRDGYSKYLE